jgi:acyl-CoA thioesterase
MQDPAPDARALAAASGADAVNGAARAMWSADRASQALGMRLEAAGGGAARIAFTIGEDMLNGHGTCHGGFIFALADSAFAFACNSHGERAVAQHCAITYLAPAHAGSRLVAEARERARRGRTGIYEVVVRDERGEVVALFEGLARFLGTPVDDTPALRR